jgi:flagellar assembly protein FliH
MVFPDKKKNQGNGLSQDPADGPARVVKPGDWGAVPGDLSMKGFQMAAFSVPGRIQPKANSNPAEEKIAELTREQRRLEAQHKQEMEKAARQADEAAKAAATKAREEGLREGETKAWDRYSRALEELQAKAGNVLATLSGEKAALFLSFEGQAAEFAALCVRKVFENMAEGPLDAVLPLLKKAVAALGDASSVTLKVHPADFRTVEENKPFWLPVDAGIKDIRIVPDARIEQGGCLVECDSSSVEMHASDLAARIEEEMKKVFEAKVRALQDPAADGAEGDTGEAP